MKEDNKIRMVKMDVNDTTHIITQMDYFFVGGGGDVIRDSHLYKATIYEFGDSPMYSAWAETPRKAVNKVLRNFDLCLGYEVRKM